ncbi:hypothetical protein C8R45DRAFT_946893 [Mycena sanguinolenta]|nr:hypothetical protein C8R45DRAFT_946893 [Mycena sanguinolenta]
MVGEKKSRGQPRATFVQRGKAATKKVLTSLLHRLSRSPSPAQDNPTVERNAGGGIILDGDEARQAQLAEDQGKTGETLLSGLDAERERKGYVLLDTIHTEDVSKWFHDQKNDYQPKDHAECQIVRPLWFGHPGDSPHDIRARKLVVRWDQVAPPQSEIRTRAIEQARPVLRWNYVCAGVNDRPPICTAHELAAQEEESKYRGSGSTAATEGDDSDTASDEGDESGVYRARWKKRGEAVALQFEVTQRASAMAALHKYRLSSADVTSEVRGKSVENDWFGV